jgi:hypothetical protein
MSSPLVDAVQAVTAAREGLNAAIVAAVESGQKVTDVAEATGLSRQRIYQIVGGKPRAKVSKPEARLAELDKRWEALVDQVAAVEAPPSEYVKRETAKRNGRRGIDKRAGRPAKLTIIQETRIVAERKLLHTLRDHPEDPAVVALLAEIREAEAIRQSLEASFDQALGITGNEGPVSVHPYDPTLSGKRTYQPDPKSY